jgi:hypothetical protein
MKRLTAENLSATPGNEELAGVFESYVNLTSCVWSDRAFHQFLFDTHGTSSEWILDDDLALFVTPRHFAAAIATGSIGEKPAPAAEGGLAALKYFDWLSEIVASAGASPVADDFIRHARWAHSVDRVSARLEAWASAMSEWRGAERDVEERRAWRRYVERVFESLTMRQRKLDIPRIEPQSYWGGSSPGAIGVPPSFEDVNNQVRSLKAQGRIGAARRVAVEAASKLYDGLSQQDATWLPRSGELVNICSLISELGDVDVAAAYVAPVRERAELIGSGLHFPSGVADHVLLAARTSPVTEQTSATTIEVSSTIPPVRTQQTQVPRTRITNARREPTNLS